MFAFIVLFSSTSFSQTPNTLPPSGNVGVGTSTPNAKLDVVGNTNLGGMVQIDSTVIIKDSVTIKKRLTIEQDIKVVGKSVFVDDGKFKADLNVLGVSRLKGKLIVDSTAIMNGDAKVFGDLKIKSLENLNISDNRLLLINSNGKVEAGLRLQAPPPVSSCTTVLPWSIASALSSNAAANDVALCPSYGNVGIGVVNPLAKLTVFGTTLLQGKVGVGNASITDINTFTDPELVIGTSLDYNRIATKMTNPQNRSIFFVPKLDNNGYSLMSKQEDAGIFWSDNTGNTTIGFVLAPETTSEYGMRIDNEGRFGFNSPISNQAQYNIKSNSLVAQLLHLDINGEARYGLRVVTKNDKDYAITVASDANVGSNTDVFRVMSNGNVFATRVRVMDMPFFPDYVFEANYELMSLTDLENFVITNKHLPKMPTAQEVKEEGADLGEINRILVEKVEELTLYMIQMNKEIEQLKAANNSLKK